MCQDAYYAGSATNELVAISVDIIMIFVLKISPRIQAVQSNCFLSPYLSPWFVQEVLSLLCLIHHTMCDPSLVDTVKVCKL